jgi:hypothetical protein
MIWFQDAARTQLNFDARGMHNSALKSKMHVNQQQSAAEQQARYTERVASLERLGHRASASRAEGLAAEYLLGQMRSIGLEASQESFKGSNSSGARLLVHVLLAAAGVAFISHVPWLNATLAALALISLAAEQMTWVRCLSRFLCRSASQNVVGRFPASCEASRRLVICAHYDTQRTGWIWQITSRLMPLQRHLPPTLKQPMLLVILMMVGQVILGAAATQEGLVRAAQILATMLLVGYLIAAVLLTQWAVNSSVPGAADNASGVAAALQIAEEWSTHPPAEDVELIILLPGCEETGLLGAAAWADRHRQEIRSLPTIVVNIDGIGFGPTRFLGAEVPVAGIALHVPQILIEICESAASELDLTDAGPHALPGPTDTLAFLARGVSAVSIVSFMEGPRLPHYHTLDDTAANMNFAAAHKATQFASAVVSKLAHLSSHAWIAT